MKLLYIFLDETKSPGVIKKVKHKIKFLNDAGIETTGLFLNRKIEKKEYKVHERIHYVPLSVKPLSFIFNRRYLRDYKWYFSIKKHQSSLYNILLKEVNNHQFDYILMRYPLANPYLLKFVRKYKGKIIFEHNSKELVEMSLQKSSKYFNYRLKQEEKFGKLVLQDIKGITGVGNEVVVYEIERRGTLVPNCVVPNGIDVKSVPLRIYQKKQNEKIPILFLTGSPSPWVGIDLVLNSLANFKDKSKISLHIVGPLNEELVKQASDLNLEGIVYFEGQKDGKELSEYFDTCAIAIGTMAMHRVGLLEHSSLKVCEYAARGIPFVLGYDDTNFYKSEAFKPYFKKIYTLKNEFVFSEVYEFAKEVITIENHAEKLKEIALHEIDFKIQMNKLAKFIISLNER